MDSPQSNKMGPVNSLKLFLEREIDYHTSSARQKLLININIGTYGDLEQEINKEWFETITPTLLDQNYCKVFYYFDSEYSNLSFKNEYLNILLDKMRDCGGISNKCNLNFESTRPFENIETCVNIEHNIIIHKIGYNLISSYDAYELYKDSIKYKITYDVCSSSIPKYKFWDTFGLLLSIFNQNPVESTLCINNYACTNSRFFIEINGKEPKCVNAYVGDYFEYVSELMYILKSIHTEHINPHVKFLIRTKDCDKGVNNLVDFNCNWL